MTNIRQMYSLVLEFLETTWSCIHIAVTGSSLPPGKADEEESSSTEDVLDRIPTRDLIALEHAISIATRVYDGEAERIDVIESKATTLVSALGVAVTLLAIGGTLFLDQARSLPAAIQLILAVLYIQAILFFGLALRLALLALRVDWFARLSPELLLPRLNLPIERLKQRELASLITSNQQNEQVADEKATYLRCAYRALWIAVLAVLLSAVTVGVYGLATAFCDA